MATSLFKSFIEAVNPGAGWPGQRASNPWGHKINRRTQSQTAQSVLEPDPASKSALETQSTNVVQSNDVGWGAVQGPAEEGENALGGSGEEIPSLELVEQIAIHRPIPVMEPQSSPDNTSLSSLSASML